MSVPKLRFNEFDGGWSNKKIGEIAVVTSGGTPSRNIPKYWNGHIPWVTTSLVDFNIINNAEEFITQDGVDNSSAKLFQKNTILMAMYGQGITRGKVAILGIDATTNQACAAIKLRDGIDTHFVFQNLMNRYEEIRDLSNEGGQKNLSAGIIKDISISYPSIPEQTKIASFLSAVDAKISQLTQKNELLSQYKQGLMQKLFSQQIRFKADDGSEFGEWGELKFKEVIKIKYGKDHKKLDDGDIPVLGTGGIMRYVNSYLYDGESILIGRKGTIDKPQFISGKFWTVDTLFYTEIGEKILPKFAFQQLLLVNWLNLNEATGVPSLNTTSIGDIELKVPSLKEQTKISNFLSSVDQKIEGVVQQIDQAKQWKKGLLQQMFV